MTANRCFFGLCRGANCSGLDCATFEEVRGEIENARDEPDAVDHAESDGVNEALELTVGVIANGGFTIRFVLDIWFGARCRFNCKWPGCEPLDGMNWFICGK